MASKSFPFRFAPVAVHICDSDSDLTDLSTDDSLFNIAIADNSGATTYSIKFPTGGWVAITGLPTPAASTSEG